MAPATRKHRTFPETIMEELRARILRGEFQAGDLLPAERELAVALGTNRSTLREALRALEAEGLLRARQGDGLRVLDFRRSGELNLLPHYIRHAPAAERPGIVADLLRLRSVMTREIVRRAAEVANDEDVRALSACLAELEQALSTGDAGAVLNPELALYRDLVKAGRSLASVWLFNSLEKVILELCATYPGIWVTAPEFLADWRAIVAGIAAHDTDAALAALDHLIAATDELVGSLLALLAAAPLTEEGNMNEDSHSQPVGAQDTRDSGHKQVDGHQASHEL